MIPRDKLILQYMVAVRSKLAHQDLFFPSMTSLYKLASNSAVVLNTTLISTLAISPVLVSLFHDSSLQVYLNLRRYSGFMQSTVGDGERSDANTAYLQPVISRSNLDVLINTRVTRLVQSGASKNGLIFNIVELSSTADSTPNFDVTFTSPNIDS